MSWVATAVIGSSLVSGYFQGEAARDAAGDQVKAARLGIDEQRRQFDAVQSLLAPYAEAGTSAISAQQDLLGLNGPEAQSTAIQALQSSPQFQAMLQQGEESILQNAAATGGLRGGNTQATLAQFSPNLLGQLINQQFSNLGAVSGLGQASAAGTGAAAQSTGVNVANLLNQQGQARAGAALAQGQAYGNTANTAGTLATLKLLGAF